MDSSTKQTKDLLKLGVLVFAVPILVAGLLTWAPPPVKAEGDVAADFKAKCASCHGVDGRGATPVGKALKLRDLSSPEVQSQSDDEILNIIAMGKGKMPAYEKTLGADKCKELVAHIRTFKQQP